VGVPKDLTFAFLLSRVSTSPRTPKLCEKTNEGIAVKDVKHLDLLRSRQNKQI
jgi:hypothetical protein